MNTNLLIEFAVLGIIFILQFKSFIETYVSIRSFKKLFPNENNIEISLSPRFQVKAREEKDLHEDFKSILKNINKFLINTKGSVEGAKQIIENLIDRTKYKHEDKIESQLSAPLYLGLCGTLIGICFGLFHLIQATGKSDIADLSSEAINGLFQSVGYAIGVSLFGLLFVIINSNFIYKTVKVKVDTLESNIKSRFEVELIPYVSQTTAAAIYDLKEHLNLFNEEFGKNLVQYKDNFSLIGDNLKAQEKVISLLSNNSFTNSVQEIAVLLKDIRQVSENFETYKEYQQKLIKSFDSTLKVTDNYNNTLNKFEGFNVRLELLTESIESNTIFNKQFSKFLSNNFPEDNSAKEIYNQQWKEVGDRLIKDIAINGKNVTKYFSDVNDEIANFSANNNNFFENFAGFKHAIEVLIKNSEMSYIAFQNTQDNIKNVQDSIVDHNEILKELTTVVKNKD
ncbi:hypothetical protein ABE426_06565 [Sphingobacterium faecium]|uniref:hypothetical protein n=1 Tax=Sphingobacterium faecium TaxID=34087 RepID=UPI003209092B